MTQVPVNNTTSEILTPAELAREYRTTKPTVLSWHHKGWIPACASIGRVIRFNRADVAKALAERSNNSNRAELARV